MEKPGDPDLVAVSATVAECVSWICALLDVRSLGKSLRLLTALRWVRSAVLHGFVVRAEKATEGVFVLDVDMLDGGKRLAHSRCVERSALDTSRAWTPKGGDDAYDTADSD